MFKTLRSKMLVRTISVLIIINVILTIVIAMFLNENFQDNIINDMSKYKITGINTIKANEVMGEPLWKSLCSINEITESYVALADEAGQIIQFKGEVLKQDEIIALVKSSGNIESRIKFQKYKNKYIITYNYPIYFNDKFYGNMLIQKDYSNKYADNIKLIFILVIGQIIAILSLVLIISKIIEKVTDPLKKLSDSMEKFRKNGESDDVVITSNDEVEKLAESYNLMKTNLKEQMEVIIKEKEKIENLEKSSREFFNNATHELKTPITAISLYSQIFKDNKLNEIDEGFIKRAAERIDLECGKMKVLVEKLLEVSRGKISYDKAQCNFSFTELVEEVLEDLNQRIENKGLIINKDFKEVKYYGVMDDIEQIILNLIDNSIKYTTDQIIDIKIAGNDDYIEFEISNKCFSFPKEIRGKLLDPFIKYNELNNMTKEVSSSGLGLYLCSELVSKNNGHISYLIKDNKITFSVKLKVKCTQLMENIDI